MSCHDRSDCVSERDVIWNMAKTKFNLNPERTFTSHGAVGFLV